MATADHIINALGGSAAIAKDERIPLTTIESWKAANFIPEWRQPTLLARSKRMKIPFDSFPAASERVSRKLASEQAVA